MRPSFTPPFVVRSPFQSLSSRKALRAGLMLVALMGAAQPVAAENFLTRLFGSLQTLRMEVSSPGQSLVVKVRGSMTVNEAETDFASVAGSVVIEERREGQKRSLTVRGGTTQRDAAAGEATKVVSGQALTRVWRVNGAELPFDEEARQWLARVLPSVLRETGLQREARIQRLAAAGGAEAVLAEIGLIRSGHARKRYLQSLLARGPLSEKQFNQTLKLIADIDGDFEKRGAIAALADTQTLSAPQQVALLGLIAGMGSDFEQRSALSALTPKLTPLPAVQTAWLNTLRSVESDYQRREAVVLLTRRGQQPALADLALQSVTYIDSDHERGQALGMVLRAIDAPTPAQTLKVVEAIRGMHSEHEQRNAMARLVRRTDPDSATSQALLRIVQAMQSSHEQAESLVLLARHLPRETAVVDAYRVALKKLPEHEREAPERALARRL